MSATVKPWWTRPVVVFDTETTGPEPTEAKVVTAMAGVVKPDGSVTAQQKWLLDPGVDIPEGAAAVHGITTEKARAEGQPYTQGLVQIAAHLSAYAALGLPVVVFNAPYDMTLLRLELLRTVGDIPQLQLTNVMLLDPLLMDRVLDKWRSGKRTLAAMAEHYGVVLGDAHEAGADAIAAGAVMYKLAEKYPAQLQRPVEELQALQHKCYRVWREDFNSYQRRKGTAIEEKGDWPLKTAELMSPWLRARGIAQPAQAGLGI